MGQHQLETHGSFGRRLLIFDEFLLEFSLIRQFLRPETTMTRRIHLWVTIAIWMTLLPATWIWTPLGELCIFLLERRNGRQMGRSNDSIDYWLICFSYVALWTMHHCYSVKHFLYFSADSVYFLLIRNVFTQLLFTIYGLRSLQIFHDLRMPKFLLLLTSLLCITSALVKELNGGVSPTVCFLFALEGSLAARLRETTSRKEMQTGFLWLYAHPRRLPLAREPAKWPFHL